MARPLKHDSQANMAAKYQVSLDTIRIWRRKKAPFSDPAAMLEWWPKTFPGRQVNPGIVREAERAIAPPAKRGRPKKDGSPQADGKGITVEIGFDATHQRMLEEEARMYQRIAEFEAAGQQSMADALRPGWMKISEALGAADTRQIKNAIQRGDLIPRPKVEQQYATLLRIHPEVLMHGMKEMRTKLDLSPLPPAAAWDAEVERLLNDLFRALPQKLLEAVGDE